jgi:hypothetical protein
MILIEAQTGKSISDLKTLCISAFVANIIKMERTQDKQVINITNR